VAINRDYQHTAGGGEVTRGDGRTEGADGISERILDGINGINRMGKEAGQEEHEAHEEKKAG
jgi:hypothetical protein